MRVRELGDPFDSVSDDDALRVPPGVFRAGGRPERTGSTNVRGAQGGFLSRFRAAPARDRLGWLTAVALVALVLIIIPAAVAGFGAIRKAQLDAQAAALPEPTVVTVSAEAYAVQRQLDSIDTAYVMSNGIADQDSRQQMSSLLEATKARIRADDAPAARTALDDAVAYFVTVYAQRLAAQVEPTIDEYYGLGWRTEERLTELRDTITENADGHDLAALVAAVIELPQQIGLAKSEHSSEYGSDEGTSSGSSGSGAPQPSQTAAPATTQAPAATAGPGGTTGNAPAPTTGVENGPVTGTNNDGGSGLGNGTAPSPTGTPKP